MFFTASYNIDKFRRFVFESTFLERYPTDEATLKKIKDDEIALLKFGLGWLKDVLFKEDVLQQQASAAVVSQPSSTQGGNND